MADSTGQERADRRHALHARVERTRNGALRRNNPNRAVYVDLARLDVTDHLAAPSAAPMPDLERLHRLSDAVLTETWRDIATEVDKIAPSPQAARDSRVALADHAWCGILVALIRCLDRVSLAGARWAATVRNALAGTVTACLSGIAKPVADAVCGIVVDRVWAAVATLVETHFPLLGDDTLRVLRMLAFFTCPSVSDHPDVYAHAVRPILGDTGGIVTDEITTHLTDLFAGRWKGMSPA